MSGFIDQFDILPKNLNPMLRGVVYVLIIVHLLVLIGWLVYACPTMFKTNNELSKERLDKLNKEKLT